MTTASRTSKDTTHEHFKYYDQLYDDFTSHLDSQLDKVLVQHVLGMVRIANFVLSRFAEGALVTRAAELSSNVRVYEILKEAGEAEQKAYSNCDEFLSKEIEAINVAVVDSFSVAQKKILEKAKKITVKDLEDNSSLPMAFSEAIGNMAARVIHHEITSRIDGVKQKYVAAFSFFVQVVVGSCDAILNDIFLSMFQPNDVDVRKTVQDLEISDETIKAGVGLFCLISDAVCCAIKEVLPDNPLLINAKIVTKIAGATLRILKLDDKWKESIAQEFLTMIEVKELAPAILKHCRLMLEEKHALYVQSHKQMVALREAKSNRSQEDNERLRTEFTPRVALLLFRLYAMQCALEKREPEQGDQIREDSRCTVATCLAWGSLTTPNSLVLKTYTSLSQKLWDELAQSFYATR